MDVEVVTQPSLLQEAPNTRGKKQFKAHIAIIYEPTIPVSLLYRISAMFTCSEKLFAQAVRASALDTTTQHTHPAQRVPHPAKHLGKAAAGGGFGGIAKG
jgi:hypothetical protein